MGKKEDKEFLYNVKYHGTAKRSSSYCKFFALIVIFLCFATLSGFVGYYIGRKWNDDPKIIVDGPNTFPNEESDPAPEPAPADYYVGVGRYDVTGPIAEVNMMGYAVPSQIAHGLHMRLYSRAFIFSDVEKKKRVVFVSIDSGMMSQAVKLGVVKKLKEKYGDLYDERNVVLSGTHSHSGPAGFFQFLLFEVTSLGFIAQSTNSFVDGIVKSIDMAHDNMHPSRVRMMSGDTHDANINRSPSAYLHNPESERKKYNFNTEQEMTVLKIQSTDTNEDFGFVTWYPVHGTSMNNTNELISSDNKGRASTLYEKMMRKDGKTNFVAAFAQANLGDVSPNTAGPICIDSGRACDFEHSTCGFPPRVQNCIAFGPGKDMFESTDMIGQRQLDSAKYIAGNLTGEFLKGEVSYSHQYVDMTKEEVTLDDGSKATTCKPAMGYSFAAGTTDGPGAFNFVQSMTEGTPLWHLATELIGKIVCSTAPTQADFDCHLPKPVLLPTGFMDRPYPWHPSIVDVQLLRVGQLIIAAVPGEFTTMAGRRLKDAIREKAVKLGMPSTTKVVIAGLSNVYTHYITTLEEFGAQRYEGGSTIYGPHTHAAYMNRFTNLVNHLVNGGEITPGPAPENILDKQIELLPKPRPDRIPEGKEFGDVIINANELYKPSEKVAVKFYGANPRHDMKLGSTYLEVQRLDESNSAWETLFTDADWETKFKWEKMKNTDDSSERKESNVITGIFDLIAHEIGYRIDLSKMEQLFNEGEFTSADLNMGADQSDYRLQQQSLIQHLVTKGILVRNEIENEKDYLFTDESHVTIEWDIPVDPLPGLYRIVYNGNHLSSSGEVTSFTGMSREFQVHS